MVSDVNRHPYILMNAKGEPKITDFGITAELEATRALLDSFKGRTRVQPQPLPPPRGFNRPKRPLDNLDMGQDKLTSHKPKKAGTTLEVYVGSMMGLGVQWDPVNWE